MESSALASPPPLPVSQRELLGLIMGCAARSSATFNQAEFAVTAAGAGPDTRPLTRELLIDLAIRGWIELRRGSPTVVRSRSSAVAGNSSSQPTETGASRCPIAPATCSPRGSRRLLRTVGR